MPYLPNEQIGEQTFDNSGLWRDFYFTSEQNQNKLFLPLNPISEKLFYTSLGDGQKHNKRLIVSALVENPICWKISKVENHNPMGLQKITLAQEDFNRATDYVNLETGEMFADYYTSTVEPTIEEQVHEQDEQDQPDTNTVSCTIQSSTTFIKVGGSYKLLTALFIDSLNEDVTSEYESSITWKAYIDDEDITESDLIIFKGQSRNSKIKIKFANDKTYLEKKLTITCESNDVIGSKDLEIIAL